MGSRPLQTYRGSCHCGSVRFEIETDFPELTMCNCSICKRKNALMVKVQDCPRRLNFEPPCRLKFEPGAEADF